jgi:hypothetical protein
VQARGKQALLFAFRKKEQKGLHSFGSVLPHPAKPIIPSRDTEGWRWASPGAASPSQKQEAFFGSFFLEKKNMLSSSGVPSIPG